LKVRLELDDLIVAVIIIAYHCLAVTRYEELVQRYATFKNYRIGCPVFLFAIYRHTHTRTHARTTKLDMYGKKILASLKTAD